MTIDLRDGDEYNLRQLIMWAIYDVANDEYLRKC